MLITLAFAEMGAILVEGWDFLGGASGLLLPRDTGNWLAFQFGGGQGEFSVMLALAAVSSSSTWRFSMRRLDTISAPSATTKRLRRQSGVDILRYKITAMVISAVLASVVGTAYVRY